MQYFKLRIDYVDSKREKYREMESKYFKNWCRCYENPGEENPHYHYYVESMGSASSIRQFIRKQFGSGGGVYSLKKVEEKPIEYLAYMVKSDKNTVWCNLDNGLKTKALEYDKGVKESIKANTSTQWRKIENYVIDKYGSVPNSKEAVIESVIEYYVTKDLMVRKFQVVSVCQTLLVRSSPEYKIEFVRSIMENL